MGEKLSMISDECIKMVFIVLENMFLLRIKFLPRHDVYWLKIQVIIHIVINQINIKKNFLYLKMSVLVTSVSSEAPTLVYNRCRKDASGDIKYNYVQNKGRSQTRAINRKVTKDPAKNRETEIVWTSASTLAGKTAIAVVRTTMTRATRKTEHNQRRPCGSTAPQHLQYAKHEDQQ